MQIVKIETGFAIKFAFEFKDNFKQTFPSAKWNPTIRQWEVGPRSGKRLVAWAAQFAQAEEALKEEEQAQEEAELTATQIADMQALVERVKIRAESAKAAAQQAKLKVQASKELQELAIAAQEKLLAIAKEELDAAQAAQAVQEAETAAAIAKVHSVLSKFIDIEAIKSAAAKMAKSMIPSDRNAKARFTDAQDFVRKQRNILRENGWQLGAINLLCQANVNRPDRDHPSTILEKEWVWLSTYTPQED